LFQHPPARAQPWLGLNVLQAWNAASLGQLYFAWFTQQVKLLLL
jgi:hypothetical protein